MVDFYIMKKIFYLLFVLTSLSIPQGCDEPPITVPDDEPGLESMLLTCTQTITNESLTYCDIEKSNEQLEIWTWNLRFFPQDGTTQQSVINVIEYYQPDIIAFQEINNRSDMLEVIDAMPLYEGWVVNVSGSLDLAFAYNTCTVKSLADPIIILDDIWPRPPSFWSASFEDNVINLMNLHLKCCGDGVEDRLDATRKIQEYILEQPDVPIIVLGDFNDEIEEESILPFLLDTVNFRYADEHISYGESVNFSFPSWPSDIDHILINQPLFSMIDTAATVLLDHCIPSYSQSISDHRPVAALFSFQ